jgi:hypothetical protein
MVPAKLLEDGEIVLLAVKPSAWFVLLVSWRVLVAAGLAGLGVVLLEEIFNRGGFQQPVGLICVAAGCLRVIFACFQWAGSLYILTNRRIMRIRGVLRMDVFATRLKQISEVSLTAGVLEGALRAGTLRLSLSGSDVPHGDWIHVARPQEVHEIVNDAVRSAR